MDVGEGGRGRPAAGVCAPLCCQPGTAAARCRCHDRGSEHTQRTARSTLHTATTATTTAGKVTARGGGETWTLGIRWPIFKKAVFFSKILFTFYVFFSRLCNLSCGDFLMGFSAECCPTSYPVPPLFSLTSIPVGAPPLLLLPAKPVIQLSVKR